MHMSPTGVLVGNMDIDQGDNMITFLEPDKRLCSQWIAVVQLFILKADVLSPTNT